MSYSCHTLVSHVTLMSHSQVSHVTLMSHSQVSYVTLSSQLCHTHVKLMSHSHIALQHNPLTSSPSTPPVAVQLSLTGATDILWLTLPLAK